MTEQVRGGPVLELCDLIDPPSLRAAHQHVQPDPAHGIRILRRSPALHAHANQRTPSEWWVKNLFHAHPFDDEDYRVHDKHMTNVIDRMMPAKNIARLARAELALEQAAQLIYDARGMWAEAHGLSADAADIRRLTDTISTLGHIRRSARAGLESAAKFEALEGQMIDEQDDGDDGRREAYASMWCCTDDVAVRR